MDSDFPPMIISSFQDRFVSLYFDLSRKKNDQELEQVKTKISVILKDSLYPVDKCQMDLMGRLVLHTRDIMYGKGERDLTYMMLHAWYEVFPEYAFHFFRIIVLFYGSWKDVPYFCDYIRRQTGDPYHPFIFFAIELMNAELKSDMASKGPISNVAKWVPREKSKFDWLLLLLCDHWTKTVTPHIFRYAISKEQKERAVKKSRYLYRKMFTGLCKKMEIVETKMCRKEWDKIVPSSVSHGSLIKYWNTFLGQSNSTLANKIAEYYTRPREETNSARVLPKNQLISSNIVNKITLHNHIENKTTKNMANILWNQSLRTPLSFGLCIPMIDVSLSMKTNGVLETAIDIGCWLAQHSHIVDDEMRLMFLGHQPNWIQIPKENLDSHMKSIISNLPPITSKNIMGGFSLLLESILDAKMSAVQVQKIKIVVLSEFSEEMEKLEQDIETLFHEGGLRSSFKTPFPPPYIVYWNLSTVSINVSCGKNAMYLSGASVSVAKIALNQSFPKNETPFDLLSSVLSSDRYSMGEI